LITTLFMAEKGRTMQEVYLVYILLYLTIVQLLKWACTYGALSYCKEYGRF